MMRKKNNNNGGMRNRSGGHQGGGQRRYHNNGSNNGGGNRNNDGQNIQRQKHHATQMREKFSNMARDAQNNGDRVDVEYYLQHVEHYTRVLTDIAAIEAERFAQQREQQPQQHHDVQQQGGEQQPQAAAEASNTGDQPPQQAQHNDAEQQQPISQSNQPRMTRGPRREPRPAPVAQTESAPDSNGDIPLPENILPAI